MEQNEKNKFRTIDSCPVCGHTEHNIFLQTKDYFLTGETFSLMQCTSCSFIFTSPVPEKDNVFNYYNSPEYSSHTLKKNNLFSYLYANARKFNIRQKYRIVSDYAQSGKILDVGCGTGELLKYFRDMGWYTTGIEPVDKAREFAIQQNKIEVYPEEQLKKFEQDTFDVVTLWHVLEHVYDLNQRLEELKKILKPEGVLFIAVPMIDSYDAVHYGSFWGALDVPRHLYHFSKTTMSNLLQKHSFHIVRTYPMKMDAYYVSLLSERYKKARTPYLNAVVTGFRSNRQAKASGAYSSMIFAVKIN